MKPKLIVLGVTGSGKSTIGEAIAGRLGVPFLDADDYHPPSNIEKMRGGTPLNDQDRQPWLQRLAQEMSQQTEGCVLACSALKSSYREVLSVVDAQFVFLKASPALIQQRLAARKQHFMPASLIDSQFEALEEPQDAIVVDAGEEPTVIVEQVVKALDIGDDQ